MNHKYLTAEIQKLMLNKKVISTGGCFDILHRGHIQYLNDAKALGDLLIVFINSDKSVQKLKGPSRPINSEKDRAFFLKNLKAVDAVLVFEEDTPCEILSDIKPDVFVKGGDYSGKSIPELEVLNSYGGKFEALTFEEGYSTTNIINKIKSE